MYSSPRVKVSFRILCLASQAGAVIGISVTLIEQLRISTKSSIFVEEAPPGSPDRIITITALPDPTSWVKLGVNNAQEKEQVEVSKAQDALIRVFEVLIERLGTSKVSCRLLMKASNVGAVKGNGGEIVKGIMKETGCKVEIRTDDLPICASHDDALVEMEGNVLAVKKALVSISSFLQACQQGKIIQHRSLGAHPFRFNASASKNRLATTKKVVLQILCPTGIAGGVIGPGGTVINTLRRKTGASIHVGDILVEYDERLIQITASENQIDRDSPTQEAIVLIYSKIHEIATKEALDSGSGSSIAARLVVPANQIGCLGGYIVSELQKKTGASSIQVLKVEQNPKCVSENNLIVEISGEFRNVKEAIHEVTGWLRLNFLCNWTTNPPPSHSLTMSKSLYKRSEDSFQRGSHSMPVNADPFPNGVSPTHPYNQELVLKILCPTGIADASIKNLQNQTGACINVGNAFADCDERLIEITASENPKDRNYPTQEAIVLVFSRIQEITTKYSGSTSITARLVVPANQIGCFLEEGDLTAFEMQIRFEASVQVLEVEQNPKCVSDNDRVVEISGKLPAVELAIYYLTQRLENNLLSNSTTVLSSNQSKFCATRSSKDTIIPRWISREEKTNLGSMGFHPSLHHSLQRGSHYSKPSKYAPSLMWASSMKPVIQRGLYDESGGLPSTMSGLRLGRSSNVTNTTVEVKIPENAFNLLCGGDGQGLQRLRQISGARIIIRETQLGTTDRIMVISGTPFQIQEAQTRLHNCFSP